MKAKEAIDKIVAATQQIEEAAAALNVINKNVDDQELQHIAVYWYALDQSHKALDTARKSVSAEAEKLNKFILPKKFEDSGMDKVRIPSVARSFYPVTKYSAKTVDADKLSKWLKGRGEEGLIKPTVNASTLASHLKDLMIDKGIEAPEDAARLNTYKIIGSSAYNPKS